MKLRFKILLHNFPLPWQISTYFIYNFIVLYAAVKYFKFNVLTVLQMVEFSVPSTMAHVVCIFRGLSHCESWEEGISYLKFSPSSFETHTPPDDGEVLVPAKSANFLTSKHLTQTWRDKRKTWYTLQILYQLNRKSKLSFVLWDCRIHGKDRISVNHDAFLIKCNYKLCTSWPMSHG